MTVDHRHIDHVTMNMNDLVVARSFYDATLSQLGLTPAVDPFGRVEYGRNGRGEFGFYGRPRVFFENAHVAFVAPDRGAVDRFYRTALGRGGTALDAPCERPEFGYYSAYVRDPEGNALEVGVGLEG
jgi:catechol 2,3-dioxygenase-like lactoylglutathione lyase family enzyme